MNEFRKKKVKELFIGPRSKPFKLSVGTIFQALRNVSVHHLRYRSGLFTGSIFTGLFFYLSIYEAPKLESPYMRYAVAGAASTLIVECFSHAYDTINMRSKVLEVKKR